MPNSITLFTLTLAPKVLADSLPYPSFPISYHHMKSLELSRSRPPFPRPQPQPQPIAPPGGTKMAIPGQKHSQKSVVPPSSPP